MIVGEHFIDGLTIVRDFLSAQQQNRLLDVIDEGRWNAELRRRVQHYGYRYDYSARCVRPASDVPPIPDWARQLTRQIYRTGITRQEFDQLIVNEYLPGQGIAPHVDSTSCFDNEIVSISLGSSCVMTFTDATRAEQIDVLLRPGDLQLIKDEARYGWRHQIKQRRRDCWAGGVIERARRLSITFRKTVPLPHATDSR
jgi:alkylated DNA repair dioxygenase AlkB